MKDEFVPTTQRGCPHADYTTRVEALLQNPELPTGCEATSATMLLRAYGYKVDKLAIAMCLKKAKRIEKEGRFYAPHPNEVFVGNPMTCGGYGTFSDALATAMQEIIVSQKGEHVAQSLHGKTEEELLSYIDLGVPVCVWSSMYNLEIAYRGGWYLMKQGVCTDKFFWWPSNEHCLVLVGCTEAEVVVCDPLVGNCRYPREAFFRHYEQVGKYAICLN